MPAAHRKRRAGPRLHHAQPLGREGRPGGGGGFRHQHGAGGERRPEGLPGAVELGAIGQHHRLPRLPHHQRLQRHLLQRRLAQAAPRHDAVRAHEDAVRRDVAQRLLGERAHRAHADAAQGAAQHDEFDARRVGQQRHQRQVAGHDPQALPLQQPPQRLHGGAAIEDHRVPVRDQVQRGARDGRLGRAVLRRARAQGGFLRGRGEDGTPIGPRDRTPGRKRLQVAPDGGGRDAEAGRERVHVRLAIRDGRQDLVVPGPPAAHGGCGALRPPPAPASAPAPRPASRPPPASPRRRCPCPRCRRPCRGRPRCGSPAGPP